MLAPGEAFVLSRHHDPVDYETRHSALALRNLTGRAGRGGWYHYGSCVLRRGGLGPAA